MAQAWHLMRRPTGMPVMEDFALKPVELPAGFTRGDEPTDEQVVEYDRRVQSAVQGLLDRLREEDPALKTPPAVRPRKSDVLGDLKASFRPDLPSFSEALASFRATVAERLTEWG